MFVFLQVGIAYTYTYIHIHWLSVELLYKIIIVSNAKQCTYVIKLLFDITFTVQVPNKPHINACEVDLEVIFHFSATDAICWISEVIDLHMNYVNHVAFLCAFTYS